jgi:hypothetical protein
MWEKPSIQEQLKALFAALENVDDDLTLVAPGKLIESI